MGAFWQDINGQPDQGAVHVFERHSGGVNAWGQVALLTATDGAADDWFGYTVDIDANLIVVGAWRDDVGPEVDQGSAYLFERTTGGGNAWQQVAHLTNSNGRAGDAAGSAVAVDGDTVIVGSEHDRIRGQDDQGSVALFRRNAGGRDTWAQIAQLTGADGRAGDRFGRAVDLHNGMIAVGAYQADVAEQTNQGSVYTFVQTVELWQQQPQISVGDSTATSGFGYAIAMDDTTLVVGAFWQDVQDNVNQGAAYIFERNAGGADAWGQTAMLTASDGAAEDRFGRAVALDGNRIVVGASGYQQDQGAAYVFERNMAGTVGWHQVARLTSPNGAPGDRMGAAVDIKQQLVVVGVPGYHINRGRVLAFERTIGGDTGWGLLKTLSASSSNVDDSFGQAVATDGRSIVVGAFRADVGDQVDQGSASVFERNAGGPNAWGLVTRLTANDGAAGDWFGRSVALDNGTIVVGASQYQFRQGAAYVFERKAGGADAWGQVTLSHPHGVAGTEFGASVAIHGNTIAVGAPGERQRQGAVYLFDRNTSGADAWGQMSRLAPTNGAEADEFGASVALDTMVMAAGALFDDINPETPDQGSVSIFRLTDPPDPIYLPFIWR
ncbi:MAG: hypothetical protein HC837_04710 [Chloroflexaceae bacterium]|nr:hypothetical protein [Chloroflexaceae bacterium]